MLYEVITTICQVSPKKIFVDLQQVGFCQAKMQNQVEVTIEAVNKQFNPDFSPPVDELFITLATRRDTVDYINESKLKELKGEQSAFDGTISGEFPESGLPTFV